MLSTDRAYDMPFQGNFRRNVSMSISIVSLNTIHNVKCMLIYDRWVDTLNNSISEEMVSYLSAVEWIMEYLRQFLLLHFPSL